MLTRNPVHDLGLQVIFCYRSKGILLSVVVQSSKVVVVPGSLLLIGVVVCLLVVVEVVVVVLVVVMVEEEGPGSWVIMVGPSNFLRIFGALDWILGLTCSWCRLTPLYAAVSPSFMARDSCSDRWWFDGTLLG